MTAPRIQGLTLKGLALIALSKIGEGTVEDIARRIAKDVGHDTEMYTEIVREKIAQHLGESDGLITPAGVLGCIDGLWSFTK